MARKSLKDSEYAAQNSYTERMKAKGFRKFTVWIPASDEAKDKVSKLAAKLRGLN